MDYTKEESIREVGGYLIHVRQIPNYYFRRRLRQMGVAEDIVAKSEPTKWVSAAGRIRLAEGEMFDQAATMFMEIHRETAHQPPGETHTQARARLRDRLKEIQDDKVPQAAMALTLEISTKVVQKMLEFAGRDDPYTTHCPWATLDRIGAADWQAVNVEQALPTEPVTQYSITEGEIQHQRHRDLEAQRQRAKAETHYIVAGGNCWNCNATWASMTAEPGRRRRGAIEMRCRMCSRTATLRTQDAGTSP